MDRKSAKGFQDAILTAEFVSAFDVILVRQEPSMGEV
jgi:hypothetical protein